MAGDCPHILSLRNKYITADLLVVRDHKTEIFAFLIVSHNLPVGPFQHPDHRSLRPASLLSVLGDDLDTVSVKGASRPVRRDEHVFLPPFHGNKAKPLRRPAEQSHNGKGLRLPVLALFGHAGLSLRHQGVQHLPQFLPAGFGNIQKNGQLLHLHGPVRRIAKQLLQIFLSLL